MTIFQSTGREFKGNLHLHTTRSDGQFTPNAAIAAYEQAGYDFIAITDHRAITLVPEYKGRMLLLPGIEWDEEPSQSEVIHLLGIGMGEGLMADLRPETRAQEAIEMIHAHQGLCFLAHPHWSMNRLETIKALSGLDGVEVFNSVSRPPYNADRADATQTLDLLASDGLLFPTLANDDTHYYDRELFGGAIIAQADSLTREHLMDALRRGRYYASQGPRFEEVTLDGDTVRVRCSPVNAIMFNSNLAWNDHRAAQGEGLTQAAYPLARQRGERFVRVVIEDAQGRRAWLNPFAV